MCPFLFKVMDREWRASRWWRANIAQVWLDLSAPKRCHESRQHACDLGSYVAFLEMLEERIRRQVSAALPGVNLLAETH
jgi:hypothetical protein